MRRFGSLRGWVALSALAGCGLVTGVNGCGGSGSTGPGGSGDDGGDATSSGGGEDSGGSGSSTSSSSSSSGSSSSSSSSGSSSGASDSGPDSSSSSSGSGGDAGDGSSSSSGGSDSGADASSSSSSSGGGPDSGLDASDASSSADGGDSASDAPGEASVPCTPNGSACALGSVNGLCVAGSCAACGGPSGTSSACSMAYADGSSTGYVCVAGSCTPGNCNTSTDCSGAAPACNLTTHTCVACDALSASATAVVVDPLSGSNAASSTGTGTAGGQTNAVCAFKTIGHALTHLGSATTVNVLPTGPVSVAGSGEVFPISVTQTNVTITGSGGTPTVNVITGTEAFRMVATGATLTNLLIDGSAAVDGGTPNPMGTHGILVSSLTTTISNVEIRNFTEAGIRVEGGVATILA